MVKPRTTMPLKAAPIMSGQQESGRIKELNQLIKWREGKQQISLPCTANGQLSTEESINKKLSYNAAEYLSKVSNNTSILAS
ncbi:hypothetical protein [Snodgrassella sp. ESL0253]|uniref:hypothetical protein n=1 Tax=Snodgrassella sp. ESL0253 TaxID=2705031 RepID=UPI00158267AA|nr:hypothetical protein [Snodgrassella sp. ESL0253]NUE67701.1 hypothetical protein [Snodgrassella sp. ESL0253]